MIFEMVTETNQKIEFLTKAYLQMQQAFTKLQVDLNRGHREPKPMVSIFTQTDPVVEDRQDLPQSDTIATKPKVLSYAAAVNTPKPAKKKPTLKMKEAVKLIKKPSAPAKFSMLHLKLEYTYKLRRKSRSERSTYLKQLFKTLGIEKNVVSFSLIGLSVVELYVPTSTLEETRSKLNSRGAQITESFDRLNPPPYLDRPDKFKEALTHRLAVLLLRSRFLNLNHAILSGIPEDIATEAYDRVARWKSGSSKNGDPGQESPGSVKPQDEHGCVKMDIVTEEETNGYGNGYDSFGAKATDLRVG
jgi:hypothetical protein